MSSASTPATEPKLAPPGAGLPWLELQAARFLFGRTRRRLSRTQVNELFARERDLILDLVRSCPPEAAGQRILIKRLRGIEDCSRYWSVFMTLDHLRIVNASMTHVIRALGLGKVPPGQANTANVKPSPGADSSVIATFTESCTQFLARVADLADLHTEKHFSHPWFGSLDAAGWHTVGAIHMNLHRRQIERILQTQRA